MPVTPEQTRAGLTPPHGDLAGLRVVMTGSEEGGSERSNFSRSPGPGGRLKFQTQKPLGAQGRLLGYHQSGEGQGT